MQGVPSRSKMRKGSNSLWFRIAAKLCAQHFSRHHGSDPHILRLMRNTAVFKVLRKAMKSLCSDSRFVVLRCVTVAVIAATLLASCATARPHLTETAVLAIADREAIKHGYSLKEFEKHTKYNSPHI